jgi:hypothetical protein
MNSYQERKKARIDRYNEKAAGAASRSGALIKQSTDMISAIPGGQPILIGHHSENRDRNYRNRADNKMRQGIQESDKAAYYAAKAEAAENNNAISSDDPEAITKLEAKLANIKTNQEEMKKANVYYRKHKTMKDYPGLDDYDANVLDEKILKSHSWEKQPYPGYILQNNNANIRRIAKRIEELKRRDALLSKNCGDEGVASNGNGWNFDGGNVTMNAELNRIQIFFDSKPDEEIRRELKRYGFKWAPSQGAWQRQLNGNGLYAVKNIKSIQPTEQEA